MRIVFLSDECLCPEDVDDVDRDHCSSVFSKHAEYEDDDMSEFLDQSIEDEEEDE